MNSICSRVFWHALRVPPHFRPKVGIDAATTNHGKLRSRKRINIFCILTSCREVIRQLGGLFSYLAQNGTLCCSSIAESLVLSMHALLQSYPSAILSHMHLQLPRAGSGDASYCGTRQVGDEWLQWIISPKFYISEEQSWSRGQA